MRDKTVEYYEKRAAEYDKVYYRDNPGRQEELAELYKLSRKVLSGKNVLDVGSGTGFWTKKISKEANSVLGIDINPATLDEARKKKYDCPVEFEIADLYNLPDIPTKLNGLMLTYILSHIKRQDIEGLYKALMKIIPSGSPAFLCDNNLICELIPELIWDEEKINTYKRRKLENGEEFLIIKNYFKKEELFTTLEKWGRINKLIFEDYYWAADLTLE